MMKSSLIRINLIFILLVLFIPNLASAETKTFIKEYTYQASEFDSKASCRTIALEQVKRLLLEELGTYLENNTEVKNFELTKDKITALTAGIVQTQVLDDKWDGKSYWLRAEVKADPDNVAKSIDNLRKDQKKSDDLEERIKKLDEALKEIGKLRSEVALLKNDIKAQEKYNKSIETLTREGKASARRPYKSAANEIKRDGRFIAYDNGTVLDTSTNLMWAAKDNGSDINWMRAISYCKNYRGGGHQNWRMPTQDELAELFDSTKSYKLAQDFYSVHLTELIQLSACCPWASDEPFYGRRIRSGGYFHFNLGKPGFVDPASYALYFRALPVRSVK